jgi:hypothetical protein
MYVIPTQPKMFRRRKVPLTDEEKAINTERQIDKAGRVGSAISGFIPFQREREAFGTLTDGRVGGTIGGLIGRGIGFLTGDQQKGHDIGSKFGANLVGFKKGGRVKKSGKYLVHKREFIVPKKVRVTKKQKTAVSKRRSKK